MGVEVNLVQFPQFLETGKRDRRQPEQEREARRLGPLEAEPQRRRQGRARARDAGDQRADLGDADQQRIGERCTTSRSRPGCAAANCKH